MDAICKRRRRPDQGWSADWTPFGGWRGVQIGGVGRNGRLLDVGVASRSRMERGLDAFRLLAWRSDWGCMAEWTPLTGWGGVQIAVVGRNGRLSVVGVASGFLVVADLDAYWVLAWRPDWGCMADWTPVGC